MKWTTALITVGVLLGGLQPAPVGAQFLQCEVTNEPSQVLLSHEDVVNFLQALDALEVGSDSASVLQRMYLDRASPGLSEYLRSHEFGAEDFVEAVRDEEDKYLGLRDLPSQLGSQEGATRSALASLREVIPDVQFVPVYFFIGIGDAGLNAEPSEHGLLLAITETTSDFGVVKLAIVHETVHVQQALAVGIEEYMQVFGPKMSLLALAIREGTAEFLTFLSTGEYGKKWAYEYVLEHEAALWRRFEREMLERLPGDWMFATPSDPEQPVDLGYIMGARIVEAFYDRAADKARAVREILAVTDYEAFLEQSGYAKQFSLP
jgi:hypothetical protein